jgi:hypothetical protein
MFTCVADPELLNRLLWSCSTCWTHGKEQTSPFRARRRCRAFSQSPD